MNPLSRRDLLSAASGLAALGLAPNLLASAPARKRTIRVAHMTDFHVQPELHADKGMAMALDHARLQKPDIILGGGDLIMDAFASDEARVTRQWNIFQGLIKEHCPAPIHYSIGNHDVWGWNKKDSHTTGSEAEWGKKWFMDQFGYHETYHSFDFGGWHFAMLDNILLTPDGFNGMIGPVQREWLDADLAATSKPTVVVTHIPILSVTTLAGAYNADKGEWNIGGDDMTKDIGEMFKIFEKHPHVKLALCGHEHMIDRIDYKGVTYMCGGAVCGNWWKGVYNGFAPGYRMLELHEDGAFETKMHFWGWNESFLA